MSCNSRLQDLLSFGKVGESEKPFNSSVISQKGESVRANTYVCVSGGKKCSFFGKFGVLCFLETPVLRFALLPYYRRNFKSSSLKCLCLRQKTWYVVVAMIWGFVGVTILVTSSAFVLLSGFDNFVKLYFLKIWKNLG